MELVPSPSQPLSLGSTCSTLISVLIPHLPHPVGASAVLTRHSNRVPMIPSRTLSSLKRTTSSLWKTSLGIAIHPTSTTTPSTLSRKTTNKPTLDRTSEFSETNSTVLLLC